MRVIMESTGDRLQAMFNAGAMTGTPSERDLAREVQETFAVACKGLMILNGLNPNAAATTYHAEVAEQYAHLLPPEEPETPPIKEVAVKDLVFEQEIGGVASKETVRVDEPDEALDDADLSPEEKRQKYLAMDLPKLFETLKMEGRRNQAIRTRTINRLAEEHGITTLRDVLLCGTEGIMDTPGLARKSVDLIEQALTISEIGLTIKLRLQMEDVIELCPTLNDLPAKFYFKELHERFAGRSAADVLAMTKTELSGLLASGGVSNPVAAQNVHDHLKRKALDFSRAAADKVIREM